MSKDACSRTPRKLTKVDNEKLSEGVSLDLVQSETNVPPFNFGCFVVSPNTTSNVDLHVVSEIWYVTSGEAIVFNDNGEIPIRAGDFVQIDSNIPHQIKNPFSGELHVVFAYW